MRKRRCLPICHSTSKTSTPSERATRSAASRIFSRSIPFAYGFAIEASQDQLENSRAQQKSGLAPTRRFDLSWKHPSIRFHIFKRKAALPAHILELCRKPE